MTRDLHLLPNGCIVEGFQQHDKRGTALPRPIVVRLSLCDRETAEAVLEFLKMRGEA